MFSPRDSAKSSVQTSTPSSSEERRRKIGEVAVKALNEAAAEAKNNPRKRLLDQLARAGGMKRRTAAPGASAQKAPK
jgi:hypothetical protein